MSLFINAAGSATSVCLMLRLAPQSTLFPYTTLFRSLGNFALVKNDAADELHVVRHHVPFQRVPGHDDLGAQQRSEEHTSELQSHSDVVCRLLLEKKNKKRPALRIYEIPISYSGRTYE